MSDDGWNNDYADDGGYDDGSCDDYSNDGDGGGGGGGGYGEDDMGTTEYVDEVEVETPGYAEVEEANDDNYRDAEGDNEGGDDDHSNYNGSSDSNQEDGSRDDDNNDDNNERSTSMSNYEYMKPWGGTHGFMRSYGIKRSPEGYEEARDLVDTMKEMAEKHGNLQ